MSDYLYFWMMKPIAEGLLYLAALAVIILIYFIFQLPTYFKQRRCKHEQVNEDMSCNAWCRSCGKNMGFIGTYYENKKEATQ